MKRLEPIVSPPAPIVEPQSQDHLVTAMLGQSRDAHSQSIARGTPAANAASQHLVTKASNSDSQTLVASGTRGRRHNPYDDSVVLSQSDMNLPMEQAGPDAIPPSSRYQQNALRYGAGETNAGFDDIHSDDEEAKSEDGNVARPATEPTAEHHGAFHVRHSPPGFAGDARGGAGPGSSRSAATGRSRGRGRGGFGSNNRPWTSLPVSAAQLEELVAASPSPSDVPCPPGFTLTVYSGDMAQSYQLPSDSVQVTRGSIKYVDHYARYGPQTRFRFQLCHNYLHRKCAKLSSCSYIHATHLPQPNDVHLNPFSHRHGALRSKQASQDSPDGSFEVAPHDDIRVAEAYATLPEGAVLTVHAPNAGGAEREAALRSSRHGAVPSTTTLPQYIPSNKIILTVGSVLAWNRMHPNAQLPNLSTGSSAAPPPPVLGRSGPRHCAHYQFKRVCNLGSRCHFIHSKVPFGEGQCTTPPSSSQLDSGAGDTAPVLPEGEPKKPSTNGSEAARRSPGGGDGSDQVSATDPSFIAGVQYAMQCMYTPPPPVSQPPYGAQPAVRPAAPYTRSTYTRQYGA